MFRGDLEEEYARGPNALSRARAEITARGGTIVNLASGVLAQPGLSFPDGALREVLDEAQSRAGAGPYDPDPLGRADARRAIADRYARTGLDLNPDHIVVTPGTSISYHYVISILARPGEEILCPRPSYPLFDEIARLTGVRLVPYRLRESDGWRIDLEHLADQVSTATRAIVVISPHNPTGAVASPEELAGIGAVARRHGLAVIHDEVFDEFIHPGTQFARAASAAGAAGGAPLVLTLNGFSKMFALPGWKIGWIAISGEREPVRRAAWMLAQVSDAFLPVNEWAQAAVPAIFRLGATVTQRIREHLARGREIALAMLPRPGVLEIVPPAGGFLVTARIAAGGIDEETLALELLRRDGILVHPGYFYDLAGDHVVLAFVEDPQVLCASFERIVACVSALGGARLPPGAVST